MVLWRDYVSIFGILVDGRNRLNKCGLAMVRTAHWVVTSIVHFATSNLIFQCLANTSGPMWYSLFPDTSAAASCLALADTVFRLANAKPKSELGCGASYSHPTHPTHIYVCFFCIGRCASSRWWGVEQYWSPCHVHLGPGLELWLMGRKCWCTCGWVWNWSFHWWQNWFILFDILEDIPGDGDPNENTILLPLPDIDFTSNQTTITSETKSEPDFDDYTADKIFKNTENVLYQNSYSFEFPCSNNNSIHSLSIPEEPPVLLPPPEPPPLTFVSLTTLTIKLEKQLSRMGRMQFYLLLKDLFLEFKTPYTNKKN